MGPARSVVAVRAEGPFGDGSCRVLDADADALDYVRLYGAAIADRAGVVQYSPQFGVGCTGQRQDNRFRIFLLAIVDKLDADGFAGFAGSENQR